MEGRTLESITDDPDAPPRLSEPTNAPRLSLPFHIRLPIASSVSFLTGMALGLSHGSQSAGLRFRAENAHRLPQTPTGWYLYHKSKNYHMMLGGVKEGFKMGGKVSLWAGGFFTVEEAVDRLRGGRRDFFSTVVAGLGVAGGFSLWSTTPDNLWERRIVGPQIDNLQIASLSSLRLGQQGQACCVVLPLGLYKTPYPLPEAEG